MQLHLSIVNSKISKISQKKANKFVTSKSFGAQIIFIGKIRQENQSKKVTGITYDVYDQLAIKSFKKICKSALNKFNKKAKIFVEHMKGYVPLGETSIIIAVGSEHRDEAYKINRYIIEEIKHHSPIWKKEHYKKGFSKWLPGHSLRLKKKIR